MMFSTSTPTQARPARRVLLVEDQPDSRETLRMVLEMWGHEVEAEADGLRGVQKALAWRPDAAVLDIGLPLLDGWQAARQVRAALGKAVLLIALTGYDRPEDRRQSLEAGFDFHMGKPAELDMLQRLLVG